MKINSLKDSILIVLDKKDSIISLESEINKSKYINNNIIIDLKNVIVKDFLSFFKTLENNQKKKNKSLVFLTSNFNNNSEDLNLIPTLQEALDFIDLEEIERDLNLL
tara:strand:+ start:28691 stop:29011 length:321 start_codon:yes stop_codon:yes gene_type:complete